MTNVDFGAPVPVTELPEGTGKRGRKSPTPALEAWLAQLTPGQTFELASTEKDGAHPVSRVTQMRKVAGPTVKIDTYAVTPGKRYRIFATLAAPNGDGKTDAPDAPATSEKASK